MPPYLDRRLYDILRLVDHHGPIGSIQLVELIQHHGYDIKDRTIRLALPELEDHGLTEKVPGQGRRLTERGRQELEHGDVNARLEHIRTRIATLSSRVTYDPFEDTGDVIASCVSSRKPTRRRRACNRRERPVPVSSSATTARSGSVAWRRPRVDVRVGHPRRNGRATACGHRRVRPRGIVRDAVRDGAASRVRKRHTRSTGNGGRLASARSLVAVGFGFGRGFRLGVGVFLSVRSALEIVHRRPAILERVVTRSQRLVPRSSEITVGCQHGFPVGRGRPRGQFARTDDHALSFELGAPFGAGSVGTGDPDLVRVGVSDRLVDAHRPTRQAVVVVVVAPVLAAELVFTVADDRVRHPVRRHCDQVRTRSRLGDRRRREPLVVTDLHAEPSERRLEDG
ncbi:ribonuclease R [Halobiforma nitratireducens JCM 10879]|uniref:Ribonuclease R n=1 Tax=Halobiforma nitratireducens JCM 10879 TaxID=1227454 RepID=M0MC67_9EURY|nr:ribonuclease R [Halobiforma nitratireducens JCM 10879]